MEDMDVGGDGEGVGGAREGDRRVSACPNCSISFFNKSATNSVVTDILGTCVMGEITGTGRQDLIGEKFLGVFNLFLSAPRSLGQMVSIEGRMNSSFIVDLAKLEMTDLEGTITEGEGSFRDLIGLILLPYLIIFSYSWLQALLLIVNCWVVFLTIISLSLLFDS